MKKRKTYEDICAEARERTMRINAEIEASPTYAQTAAEWEAEYEAGKGTPEYDARDRQARLDMEAAVAYVETKAHVVESFATAMRTAQKLAKLTQTELAKRVGVAQSCISLAMRGNVTSTTLARILAACGCEMEVKVRRVR